MARHKKSKGRAERRARAQARAEQRAKEIAEAKAVARAETVTIESHIRTARVEWGDLPPMSDMGLAVALRVASLELINAIRRA